MATVTEQGGSKAKHVARLVLHIVLALVATIVFHGVGWNLFCTFVDRMHVLARGWNVVAIPMACAMNYLLFSRRVRLWSYSVFCLFVAWHCLDLRYDRPYYLFESVVTIGSLVMSLIFMWVTRAKVSPFIRWRWWKRLLLAFSVFAVLMAVCAVYS